MPTDAASGALIEGDVRSARTEVRYPGLQRDIVSLEGGDAGAPAVVAHPEGERARVFEAIAERVAASVAVPA